jgi:hypothetical protein
MSLNNKSALANVFYTLQRRKDTTVCNAWKNFDTFKKWAYDNGYTSGARIVRIDKSKGFSPTNTKIVKLNYVNNMNIQLQKMIGVDPRKIKIKIL